MKKQSMILVSLLVFTGITAQADQFLFRTKPAKVKSPYDFSTAEVGAILAGGAINAVTAGSDSDDSRRKLSDVEQSVLESIQLDVNLEMYQQEKDFRNAANGDMSARQSFDSTCIRLCLESANFIKGTYDIIIRHGLEQISNGTMTAENVEGKLKEYIQGDFQVIWNNINNGQALRMGMKQDLVLDAAKLSIVVNGLREFASRQ